MPGAAALRQVHVGKAEERGMWAMGVKDSLDREPSGSAQRHHIASSECLLRHHHVGSL